MNPIEKVRPESFFAEFILPLSRANARRRVRYLELERGAESYWGPVATRTGGMEKVPAAGAGAAAMLENLRDHWASQGDAHLPKLTPYLAALRETLVAPQTGASETKEVLSEFVYPLF
jgi:hypothetical protein